MHVITVKTKVGNQVLLQRELALFVLESLLQYRGHVAVLPSCEFVIELDGEVILDSEAEKAELDRND